jgi:glycine cleavage system H protein
MIKPELELDIEFTDELWARPQEGCLIIGVKQDFFDDVNELWGVDLPEEGAEVSPEEICGEVETDQGPVNIYTPIEGEVVEVNTAVVDDPDLLFDDSTEEGWLIKIRPHEPEDLQNFMKEHSDDPET